MICPYTEVQCHNPCREEGRCRFTGRKEWPEMPQRETDFAHGHAPRTQLGAQVTRQLQEQQGVTELNLRNTVELILAVVALREVLDADT